MPCRSLFFRWVPGCCGFVVAAALAVSVRGVEATASAESPARAPNVVLVVVDDLDRDEVGAYGGAVRTPVLDRLAARGARFDRAYVPSAACTPSRYAILTGRRPSESVDLASRGPRRARPDGRARVDWAIDLLEAETTIADILRREGWRTGYVGKWHLGPRGLGAPSPGGLPVSRLAQAQREASREIRRHGFDVAERLYPRNISSLGLPDGFAFHHPEWIVEGAIDFAEREDPRPFFLVIAPTLTHSPPALESLAADPRNTPAGRQAVAPRSTVDRRAIARDAARGDDPGARAAAAWLDATLGDFLRALEARGVAERTIVVVVSDHGKRGKGTCYEACRVPMIVSGPGVAPGRVASGLVSSLDLVPTLLEACGVAGPTPSDGRPPELAGRSLWPWLTGAGELPGRDGLVLEMTTTRAFVTEGHKYIAFDRTGSRREAELRRRIAPAIQDRAAAEFPAIADAEQLYDLRRDPLERRNLAGSTAHAATLAALRDRLRGLLGESTVSAPDPAKTSSDGTKVP